MIGLDYQIFNYLKLLKSQGINLSTPPVLLSNKVKRHTVYPQIKIKTFRQNWKAN